MITILTKTTCFLSICLLLTVPAMAQPSHHDYSQYFHWADGYVYSSNDEITSVKTCTIQGTEYLASIGLNSGLGFFGLLDGNLELKSHLPLAGVEQDVVVQDLFSYVVATPNFIHKVLTLEPDNPSLLWTANLPAAPHAVAEFGDYLLIACGENGLLVFDPAQQFGQPVGVIGAWIGEAQEIHVIDHRALVRMDAGLAVIDLSDPTNPIQISSITTNPTQDLAVDGSLAYLAVQNDIVEIDIIDPANPFVLRTLTSPTDTSDLQSILPYGNGLVAAASNDLHYWDLASGEMTWSESSTVSGQDLDMLHGKLALACGTDGLQLFENILDTASTVTSPTFTLEQFDRGSQIVGDLLLIQGYSKVTCFDLASDPVDLLWEYQVDGVQFAEASCLLDGLLYLVCSDAKFRVISFDRFGATEVGNFYNGAGAIRDLGSLENGYLAAYSSDPGIEIWDVSDLNAPQLCSVLPDNSHTEMVATGNTVALIDLSSSQSGIRIYDMADPYQPVATVNFDLFFESPHTPKITATDGFLYIVKSHQLQVLDVSDPHNLQIGPEIYIPNGFKFIKHGAFGYLLGADLVFDLSDPLIPRAIGSFSYPDFSELIKLAVGDGYLVFGDWSDNRVVMPEHGSPAAPTADPLPRAINLNLSAAPNPFNPRVVVSFEMAAPGSATLLLYDVRGNRLDSHHVQVEQAGPARMEWNGTNSAGRPLPSGVYLVEVRTDVGRDWIKVMLVR